MSYNSCLLINQNLIFKDKAQTIEVDNILKSGKKEILAQQIKDKFTKAILGKTIIKEKEIKEFVRNNIEVKIENGFLSKIPNKTNEQELPPNIIRTETLDESEEFIEIILPPTLGIDDPPLIDASAMFIPALRGVGSAIKGIKGISKLNRSLSREEVVERIKKLPKAFDSKGKGRTRIYLVETKEKLLELWEELTRNFKNERIEKNPKGTRIIRMLDDGTEVSLREYSSKVSGNSQTIDTKINDKNYKIHIDIRK